MKSACHKGWSRLFGVALMTLTLPAIAQENRPPKVDITSPPRGAHFTAPADLKLIAQTADADGWVGTVAFFSGDTKIGESVIQFLQPPKPGTLIVHELQWRAEKPGVYHFTAVATDDGGAMTTTDPIEIILDPVMEQALVNVQAIKASATELGDFKSRALIFEVSRTGAVDFDMPVFYSVHGTAQNGIDYESLSGQLTIPAGAASSVVVTLANADDVAEDEETLVLRIEPPACPEIFPPPRECYLAGPQAKASAVILANPGTAPLPVVRIEATQPVAEEDSAPLERLPLRGRFTISRTGPTDQALPVFLHYSGTATPGEDYPFLPWLVTIPVGATSTAVEVVPVLDKWVEGLETLVATLSHCPPETHPPLGIPCYVGFEIDPAHGEATVFLRDDGLTQASLAITKPKDGTQFIAGAAIAIEALAIDLKGYISRVEFWDGEQKIGVSEIVFIRPPDPGTPIQHTFEWRGAAAGPHVLTCRAARADGSLLRSPPVNIEVGLAPDRVILEIEATDPLAAEAGPGGAPDQAVFTIRRVAGARDLDVTAFYSVSGTAMNGIDYPELSGRVQLPAGSDSVAVTINPVPDKALEGEETVILRLEPPICIAIFPPPPECYLIGPRGVARAVIQDKAGEPNQPPGIRISRPAAGTKFGLDEKIEIVVEGKDPDGYILKVEFLADQRKIGEALSVPPPVRGQAQVFTFVWRAADPGAHLLTARATDNSGGLALSAAVEVRVVPPDLLPVVRVTARDAFAVEPQNNGALNTASFRIRRSGPTTEDLVVAYSLGGTAENGADYERLPGLITIPAGQRWATVVVSPIHDDAAEVFETVVLKLAPPPPSPGGTTAGQYRISARHKALALISDKDFVQAPGGARCVSLAGGVAHLCFKAEDGQYRLEATRDFLNWETIFDSVAVDGALHFLDEEGSAHPYRFYRISPELPGE